MPVVMIKIQALLLAHLCKLSDSHLFVRISCLLVCLFLLRGTPDTDQDGYLLQSTIYPNGV